MQKKRRNLTRKDFIAFAEKRKNGYDVNDDRTRSQTHLSKSKWELIIKEYEQLENRREKNGTSE